MRELSGRVPESSMPMAERGSLLDNLVTDRTDPCIIPCPWLLPWSKRYRIQVVERAGASQYCISRPVDGIEYSFLFVCLSEVISHARTKFITFIHVRNLKYSL